MNSSYSLIIHHLESKQKQQQQSWPANTLPHQFGLKKGQKALSNASLKYYTALYAIKSVHTHIYVQWMTRPLNPTHVEKYQRPHAKVKKLRRNRWLIFDELTELTVFITQHGNPRQMYANKAESLHSTPSHTHTHTPSECYYFVYCC